MLAKCREIALESEIPSRIVNCLSNGNLEKSTPQSPASASVGCLFGKERLAQTSVIASLFVVKSGRLRLKLSTPPRSTQFQHFQSDSNRHQYPRSVRRLCPRNPHSHRDFSLPQRTSRRFHSSSLASRSPSRRARRYLTLSPGNFCRAIYPSFLS